MAEAGGAGMVIDEDMLTTTLDCSGEARGWRSRHDELIVVGDLVQGQIAKVGKRY